jgi:hypothetical protein
MERYWPLHGRRSRSGVLARMRVRRGGSPPAEPDRAPALTPPTPP